MSELEGGAPRAPARPSLAYLEGEAGGGFAEREDAHLRQDSADGDVIETTFSTDLVMLQQQLGEKARTAERAILASLDLRNELNAVRAEAAALKETVRSGRKAETAPPPEEAQATSSRLVGDAFAELAKVRTESFKAQKELERERNEHRAEMIQARAQYHATQDELQRMLQVRRTNGRRPPTGPTQPATAILPPPAPVADSVGREWKKLVAAFVFLVVTACATLVWRRFPSPATTPSTTTSQARAPERPEIRPPRPSPSPSPPPSQRPAARATTAEDIRVAMTPGGRAQFQSAVGRLSRSLSGHYGKAPEEILREVHERYKATDPSICAFDWHHGQPSLLYGGGNLSIGQNLQRCADAVDRSR